MMIERIDTYLINNVFDPISHKVQKKTGHTCYYIAWWFMGMSLLAKFFHMNAIFQKVSDAGGIQPEWAITFWMGVVATPFFIIVCVSNLYKMQKMWERSDWKSSAMPETRMPMWIYIRVFMIAVAALDILILVIASVQPGSEMMEIAPSMVSWVCLTIAEYFAACTPLPPSAHKKEISANSKMTEASVMRRDAA